jgi:Xaa-Pro dipeptidase
VHRRAFVTGSLAALSLGACSNRPVYQVSLAPAAAPPPAGPAPSPTPAAPAPAAPRFAALHGFCAGAAPIAPAEQAERRERARAWLKDHGLSALLVEAGDNLRWLTGVAWGRSERPLLYLLPVSGPPALIAPAFEENTLRERAGDVPLFLWHEHESPHAKLAEAARAAGLRRPRLAVDPWTRQFVTDGARAALTADVSRGAELFRFLRARKTPAELALLRRANEATKAALKAAAAHCAEDMSEAELAAVVGEAQAAAGLSDTWALVLFGANAAYPHGTRGERRLRRGDLILVDAGGGLHDYRSDITRTWPFGPVSDAQARAWEAVRRAQTAALAELRPGRPCEAADAAARAVIAAAGYGPDYARFTHRLGHGIGVQTHEDPYLVRGNRELLAPAMTMSNEPGVYIPGELGVRLEDIVAITDGEPEVFGPLAASLDAPFG